MDDLHVLIMAGGAGTRFWPQSRRAFPKQFLHLAGERSLIAETVRRVEALCPPENVWVLTREDLRLRVLDELPQLRPDRVVGEPEGRDTAPCLVFGGVQVERVNPDARVLVLPADHVIPDRELFCETVKSAATAPEALDGIVTFGIPPTRPSVGYGYIRRVSSDRFPVGSTAGYPVDSFREKPDAETARSYLAEGNYYWNAGIFLWRLATFRASLAECAPELYAGWERLRALSAVDDPRTAERFRALPRISIDYALLEKARNVWVVEAPFAWDDVGSWRAIERYRSVDPDGNISEGPAVLVDTARSSIVSSGGKVIATLGVEDLLVVDTPDALLICHRDRVEEVKRVVDKVREQGRTEVL